MGTINLSFTIDGCLADLNGSVRFAHPPPSQSSKKYRFSIS